MKKRLGSTTYVHISKANNLISLAKYKICDIQAFFFKMHKLENGEVIEIASAIDTNLVKDRDDIFIQELQYPIYQHKIVSFIEDVNEILNYNNIELPVDLIPS